MTRELVKSSESSDKDLERLKNLHSSPEAPLCIHDSVTITEMKKAHTLDLRRSFARALLWNERSTSLNYASEKVTYI